MSVSFAVLTSDPNLLQCELVRLQDQVLLSEKACNGAGLGSYAQEDILLERFRSTADLPRLARLHPARESEAIVYHARELPLGMSPEENTQPFRYRRWMFCHSGSVSEFARVKTRLIASLPEFLQRQIQGDTDSEVVFALFLKLVRDTGRMDDPLLEPSLAAQLLGRTVRHIQQLSSDAGVSRTSTLNCIATNGSLLVATRCGATKLFYTLLEGSDRCERCGIGASTPDALPLVRAHRRRKTVAIASHLARASSWIEIPDGTAVAVGRDLNVQRLPIGL